MMEFTQTVENDIRYFYSEFCIANVTYLIIFSDDRDTLAYFAEDDDINRIIQGRTVYSIKFAVKAYIENETADFYAPPENHHFGKTEITQLKRTLEQFIYAHYQQFKPDCYVFIAERPSLTRMYKKMCRVKSELMLDFTPIVDLGDEQDCFIVKTPHYKE